MVGCHFKGVLTAGEFPSAVFTLMIPNILETFKKYSVRLVHADETKWQRTTIPGVSPEPAVFEDLEYVMNKGLEAIFALGGLVAFAYFVIGGFKYLTAGGDEKTIDTAKKTITYAIIGLLVVIASWIILNTLGDPGFLNLPSILEFTIPQ